MGTTRLPVQRDSARPASVCQHDTRDMAACHHPPITHQPNTPPAVSPAFCFAPPHHPLTGASSASLQSCAGA